MEPPEAWSVGPWRLEPRGLAACGNPVEPPCPEIAARITVPVGGGGPRGGGTPPTSVEGFVDRLSQRTGADEVITAEEIDLFLQLQARGEDLWEPVSVDDWTSTRVERYRDRSSCGGVFVRLSATLRDVSVEHAAACYLDWEFKKTWDRQIFGFRLLHSMAGTDVLYYILHASPLTNRDFVTMSATLRHESGRGLLMYMRGADPALVPRTRAVRGLGYLVATEVMQQPDGSVTVTCTSACDPCIPFMPRWIMNALIPSEWRKNMHEVKRRCDELRTAGRRPACAVLFGGEEVVAKALPQTLPEEPDPPTREPTPSMATGLASTAASDSELSPPSERDPSPRPKLQAELDIKQSPSDKQPLGVVEEAEIRPTSFWTCMSVSSCRV